MDNPSDIHCTHSINLGLYQKIQHRRDQTTEECRTDQATDQYDRQWADPYRTLL
jgi:hypothetical protein